MKKWLSLCLLVFLAGCTEENPTKVTVDMYNADGDSIGTIQLSEQTDGVEMNFDLDGLSSGNHAIHFHSIGLCEAPDFMSAGDHFNPEQMEHGLLNDTGAHLGDLPNMTVDESGTYTGTMKSGATLKDGKNSLVTREGTSSVIHAGADDGMRQPAGDSGERIACGVISKDKEVVK